MKASVESMGGTTLAMIMPPTLSMASPAGENRFRSRMPHSWAVWSGTVRSRHWQTSLRPSNAPIVILLLPASRASSTYASCKNQGIGSVVFAHDEEPGGVEAGRGSLDRAIRLFHRDAPPACVAGSSRKQPQDLVLVESNKPIDSGQQSQQDFSGADL